MDEADVEELGENVAPFFGNTVFTDVYGWQEDYPRYSLYEAFASYHDEVVADVQARLPEERPSVAVLFPAGVPPEKFFPYPVNEGTSSRTASTRSGRTSRDGADRRRPAGRFSTTGLMTKIRYEF